MCRGRFRRSVEGGDEGVCSVVTGMGREDVTAHVYKNSLQWWFHCIRLETCVGSVCVGGTTLMCHRLTDGNVHDRVRQLDSSSSTCHWLVEVHVPQGPHQGVVVVFTYTYVSCEHYTPKIYR